MSDTLAAEVIATNERLDGDRVTWLEHWQRVAQLVITNRSDYIVQKTPGQRREQYVYDATAVFANEQLAAQLHSQLTSDSLLWAQWRCEDDRLNDDDDCRLWLDAASRAAFAIYSGTRHNFSVAAHELYLDVASIGSGCMAVLESERNGIVFSTRHMKECCWEENEEGRVDLLSRKWSWTAKQAYQAWGEAAGEMVCKAAMDPKEQTRQFTFVHEVQPRRDRDPTRWDARNKPFRSVYVCRESKHVVAESGFNEFPYMCPRLSKVSGEKYGRGRGMAMLPFIATLNEMVRTIMKAAQKIVDPPILLPDDGFLVPLKQSPGALNYYRAGMRDEAKPLHTGGDIQLGRELLNDTRQLVMRGFYNDWFTMPSDPSDPSSDGKGITATYTLRDRDEKMQLASPLLGRMRCEWLGPLNDRVLAIMWRQSAMRRFGPGSLLPPPPAKLSGAKLRAEYLSPIAIAQRSSQMEGMSRLIQIATMLAQANPQRAPAIMSILDDDAIMRIAGRDLNTPAAALKSPERLAAEAQAQAQAEAEMNAHAQALAQGKALQAGGAGIKSLADAAGGAGGQLQEAA